MKYSYRTHIRLAAKIILLTFITTLCYSAPHKNLQSFYCHSYEQAKSCSESCVNYYDQENHHPIRKNGMKQDDEIWIFTQFRFHKGMNKLIEQSAYMSRKKKLLPRIFDYTVSSDMNYCRQFNYIDDDNWVCLDEADEETGKKIIIEMKKGIFSNINMSYFEDEENIKNRESKKEYFTKNGSPYLECMKEIPVGFIEYKN